MYIAIECCSALVLTVASAECFRVLQQASYRPQRGYFKIYLTVYYLCALLVQVAAALVYVYVDAYLFVNLALYVCLAVGAIAVKRKCPLRLTARVWRMITVTAATFVVLCVFVGSCFCVWLLPIVVLVAWAVCLPVEAAIANYYLKAATGKLSASGVTVIAVTGSYGKTSVKDMLSALLKDSITPAGSCNTPLGIAAFINRTELAGARYLVLEFGARKRGDIAKLCGLYKPKYGIVTGVCAQHLSTFGSLDNVIATKRELVEELPKDGFCVLNGADEVVTKFAEVGKCAKYMSCCNLQISVKSVDLNGTLLCVEASGERAEVRLPQISDYVKDTFAMCLQMALRLNQTVDEICSRATFVRQTPHRMELVAGVNCHILDDSYNASITGVTSCVKTLAHFDVTKVVITQGLVECGKQRKAMNVECGKLLGSACDVAVVLGRNAKCLVEGLNQTSCRVICARDLKQAVKLATEHVNGGILLFQNDLPDVAV